MNIANLQGIAFFIQSANLSGAEKRVAKLAKRLSSMGVKALIFADTQTADVYRKAQYVDNSLIRTWEYPFLTRVTGIGRQRLAKLRRVSGLDQLHLKLVHKYWRRQFAHECIGVSHVFINPAICRDLPCPKLYEITSPDMARVLENKAAQYPGDFFPPETLLRPNSESVEAALGPTLRRWQIQTSQTALFIPDVEQEINLHNKENLIVFAHRLVARKHPLVFAQAVKQFLTNHHGWKFAILGDGEQKSKVIECLKDEVQEGRVEVGYVSNVHEYLARSKIFVSIESEDNYSNQSVLEAMWAYNALLLTDRGATRKRYFNDNGLFCEPEVDSVASALEALIEDDARLSSMACASRRLVEETFSVDAYIADLERAYREVLPSEHSISDPRR